MKEISVGADVLVTAVEAKAELGEPATTPLLLKEDILLKCGVSNLNVKFCKFCSGKLSEAVAVEEIIVFGVEATKSIFFATFSTFCVVLLINVLDVVERCFNFEDGDCRIDVDNCGFTTAICEMSRFFKKLLKSLPCFFVKFLVRLRIRS